MTNDPSLARAYALKNPDDSVRLYRDWARTYDTDFVSDSGYILHREVARQFALLGGFGPVLDVGAGTGQCGAALRDRGIVPVDGMDISPEMLDVAAQKGAYRHLFSANLLEGLPIPEVTYQGAVSSGTFTHGHVGPEGLDPLLNVLRPGAWVVISVNSGHYAAANFDAKLAELEQRITQASRTDVPIYGPDAMGNHAKDRAFLISFRTV